MAKAKNLFVIISFTVGFATIGELLYEVLITFISGANAPTLIATSVTEFFQHKLWSDLSFALLGFLTGTGCMLLQKQARSGKQKTYAVLIPIVLGCFAAMIWTLVLKSRVQSVRMATEIHFSLPLDAIPVHQIGLFSSVWVIAGVATLIYVFRKEKP